MVLCWLINLLLFIDNPCLTQYNPHSRESALVENLSGEELQTIRDLLKVSDVRLNERFFDVNQHKALIIELGRKDFWHIADLILQLITDKSCKDISMNSNEAKKVHQQFRKALLERMLVNSEQFQKKLDSYIQFLQKVCSKCSLF